MSIDSRHRAILAALARHDVAFVLIGGVGCQVHGWTHATRDVDVIVATDEQNIEAITAALAEMGAGSTAIGALGTSLRTPNGRLELLRDSDGVGDFAAWRTLARRVELGDGVAVLVGDPDDLLRSKEAANRDKDREQLAVIRRDLIVAGTLDAALARGPVARPEQAPAPHLVALLGSRPGDGAARAVWDATADAVTLYRRRHAIDDERDALGATPAQGAAVAERRHLEEAVARARRIIAQAAIGPEQAGDRGGG